MTIQVIVNAKYADCIESYLGVIPHFFQDDKPYESLEDLKTQVAEAYGFPLYEITGGYVDQFTGVYYYPDDEPLDAVAVIHAQNGSAIVYAYDMVCLVFDGQQFMTRMD